MSRFALLCEQRDQHRAAARTIVDAAKAAARDLTADERTDVQGHVTAVRDLEESIGKALEDAKTSAAIRAFGDGLGAPDDSPADAPDRPAGHGVKVTRAGSRWAKDATNAVRRVIEASGTKALVSGSLSIAAPVTVSALIPAPERPTRVIELITDRVTMAGNVFAYLQHSSARTENAAPVPDGGTKPTSVYTVNEVEDRARVIAHLSEPVVLRLFDDYNELEGFLRVEMEAGVLRALEREIVNGDATGEHFRGLLNTSGILAQSYSVSPWVSIRKALTTLEINDEVPTAIVVHPTDAEAFDLAREGADGGWLLATAPGNITEGLPLVHSTSVPAGTAIVGDWRTARLYVREEAKLDVDRSGGLFETNRVRMRLEGRYGVAFNRPAAFAAVDLTP